MSADPLEVHAPGEADANLYAYVSGRAVQAVDPLGLAIGETQSYCATKACFGASEEVSGDETLAKQSNPLTNAEGVRRREASARAIVRTGERLGMRASSTNLRAFLDGSGNPHAINLDTLRRSSAVREGVDTNGKRLIGEAIEAARGLKPGETRGFSDYFDRRLLTGDYKSMIATLKDGREGIDMLGASGPSVLRTGGAFQVTRGQNGKITITGTLEHRWEDRYDWHPGKKDWVPGHGWVEDRDMNILEAQGNAESYDMDIYFKQSVQIEITQGARGTRTKIELGGWEEQRVDGPSSGQ